MTLNSTINEQYMRLALSLAARGALSVSPNPMVGCVLVKDDRIVGTGYHQYAGGPHAEVIALNEAKSEAMGATAYVTLEPCCHTGKTPPCTTALIHAGVKKVVISCLDPNPLVHKKGIERLRQANIDVDMGLLKEESEQLNQIFFHYMRTKRPFVIAKWAMSLDGKTTTHPEDDRYISSNESLATTHQLRQQVDAIIVGAKTATQDDPQLTVRTALEVAHKHPIRVVVTTKGLLPTHLRLFSNTLPGKTIVATTTHSNKDRCNELKEKNIELIYLPLMNGQVDLNSLLIQLGLRGVTSVLVEGGMTLHDSFIKQNLVDRFQVFISPLIIGSLHTKRKLITPRLQAIGPDYCITGEAKPCSAE